MLYLESRKLRRTPEEQENYPRKRTGIRKKATAQGSQRRSVEKMETE